MGNLSSGAGRVLFALLFSSSGEVERMCGVKRQEFKKACDALVPFFGNAPDLEQVCKLADESQDRRAQVQALQQLWDERFPIEQYPYQRLQAEAAKGFLRLAGNSAYAVYEKLRSVDGRERHLEYPRSYVEKILKKQPEPEPLTKEYWITIMKEKGLYGN